MSQYYDHGPLRTYEVVWRSGHTERVQGHQVTFDIWASPFGGNPDRSRRMNVHGEFDGHWRLVLSALEEDIQTVRDVTTDEAFPADVVDGP